VQDEDLDARHLGHPVDAHLARRGRHRRAADGPGQAGNALVSLAEDVVPAGQRHREVVLRAGVALDEHVVGDHAHPDLRSPHLAPGRRVVVDRPDQRGLGADHRAGVPDPAHRLGQHRRLELARMGEVRHHREIPARGDDLAEQPQGVIGVRVGDEPLRPVGQRLGAEPDRLDVVQAVPRVDERLDVPAQYRLAHDHGIAPGDQDAGHLGVLAQIGHQRADVVGGHLQVGLVHELGPAEAVAAVRVAGLALPGEEQHGFLVLVLQARQRPALQAGRVQQQLARRMGVEPHPDLVRGGAQPGRGLAAVDHVRESSHVGLGQHVRLREDEPVDRVVGGRVPVDQVLHHVRVRPERKHGRHRPHRQPLLRRQPGPLHQRVQMLGRVGTEPAAC